MALRFGNLDSRDFDRAIEHACAGMRFDRFIGNERIRYLYGKFFLSEELQDASQVAALYDDDKLVGLLLANMNDEAKACRSWGRGLYVALVGLIVRRIEKDYRQACARMLSDYQQGAKPDGELSFLAVDPAIQGKGLGSILLEELARREPGKLVYLYTDNNCTFQFYEHRGFSRECETAIDVEKVGAEGSTPQLLECYLYAKRL